MITEYLLKILDLLPFIIKCVVDLVDIIKETLIDGIKLLPFLFLTYLIMEFIEHKTEKKAKDAIQKAGKIGPLLGSILGVFPQCGFSVSATNLYAGRVITLGTLIAVYLSTSDEMLPIFISEAVSPLIIIKILGIKLIIGIIFGFIIDLIISIFNRKKAENKKDDINIENNIEHFCEKSDCHCNENSIWKSALKHTFNIFGFIIIISFIINIIISIIGEEQIANILMDKKILGPILTSAVGLIPNCAASVIITNLYLQNIISFGSMIAGLLTGAGIGLAVLFKINKNLKENIGIIFLIYAIGVISGSIIEIMNVVL